MKGTTELRCPVCDSNQLTISNKSFIGDADMSCNACGYTFKSSAAKVAVAEEDQSISSITESPGATNSPASTRSFDQQLLDLVQQKGKLHAVKFCKDNKSWGLKESKDYVDRLAAQHGIKGKEGCFVATACYGDYDAPEVVVLRKYRDDVLGKTFLGRMFIRIYYKVSPSLANMIARSGRAKRF
ncbi:MAG TPA: CFI-box-CTERM domain-containing protein, partial [Chitinophagaceae bacterium]|nr:CFI-box-CTERM domain-containing protein [Chitinophagaceae bacterium]